MTRHSSVCLLEYNLVYCKYLNLYNSSIIQLDVRLLVSLRVLVLKGTCIKVLQAEFLINLVWLDIDDTQIEELCTSSFALLEQLWAYNVPITTLDTRSLGNVRYLGLSGTRIDGLQVDKLKCLVSLGVARTPITRLDLRACSELFEVSGCVDGERDILTTPNVTRFGDN